MTLSKIENRLKKCEYAEWNEAAACALLYSLFPSAKDTSPERVQAMLDALEKEYGKIEECILETLVMDYYHVGN